MTEILIVVLTWLSADTARPVFVQMDPLSHQALLLCPLSLASPEAAAETCNVYIRSACPGQRRMSETKSTDGMTKALFFICGTRL